MSATKSPGPSLAADPAALPPPHDPSAQEIAREEEPVAGNSAADDAAQRLVETSIAGEALAQQMTEECFQRLLEIGLRQPVLRNPMRGVSVDILLRMAGKDDHTFTATAAADVSHPSHTTVMLLKRLNEEYRAATINLRDEYEDAIAARRRAHSQTLDLIRKKHALSIGAALTQHHADVDTARREFEIENSSAADHAKSEETLLKEIEDIEHKLLHAATNASAGGNASFSSSDGKGAPGQGMSQKEQGELTTTRRLLVYWKSRYQALCASMNTNEEELLATTTKIDEMKKLMKQEPTHIQRVLTELRECETRERLKTESFRVRYVQECVKRGITPKEPRLVPHQEARSGSQQGSRQGSQVNTPRSRRSSLITSPPPQGADGQAGVDDSQSICSDRHSAAAASESAAMQSVAGILRSVGTSSARDATTNNGGGGGDEESGSHGRDRPPLRVFSSLGPRDARVMAGLKKLQLREEEEADLRRRIEEHNNEISVLTQLLEEAQAKYAVAAGKVAGATASIYEEIVSLRAKLDVAELEAISRKADACEEEIRHASVVVQATMEAEKEAVSSLERSEQVSRFLREKDLDVLRGGKRLRAGMPVSDSELSDAPTIDVSLRVEALLSQLEVLDADRQVLRHQVERAQQAMRSSSEYVDRRLGLYFSDPNNRSAHY